MQITKLVNKIIIFIYIVMITNNASALYTCSVSSHPNINFGNITIGATHTINSNISVTCSGIASLQVRYTISLSTGSGSYTNRTMKRGSNIPNYQLYDNST
ncbi:MAG: spore coat protein U domain-containing protein [Candidatus Rickettsia vulgarisii]